jgi:hypothetical protein
MFIFGLESKVEKKGKRKKRQVIERAGNQVVDIRGIRKSEEPASLNDSYAEASGRQNKSEYRNLSSPTASPRQVLNPTSPMAAPGQVRNKFKSLKFEIQNKE